MKTLQLNLANKLLIIDYGSKEKLDQAWHINSDPKMHTFHTDGSQVKALFNGLKLTEEDYRSLITDEDGGISISKHPLAYKISYSRHKNAFVDLIEKEGFYWLENPIEQPIHSNFEEENDFYSDLQFWKYAEEKTLRFPIIFEILE